MYIPHLNCQASLISKVSGACTAVIVYINHFFHLNQQNKSYESKEKFLQGSNHYKRVLETAKLAYANKTKNSYHFPGTWLPGLLANC